MQHRLKVSSVADEQTVWTGDPKASVCIIAHVFNAGCGEALSRPKLVKPAAIVSKEAALSADPEKAGAVLVERLDVEVADRPHIP